MVYPLKLPKTSALYLAIRKPSIASCVKLNKVARGSAEAHTASTGATFWLIRLCTCTYVHNNETIEIIFTTLL